MPRQRSQSLLASEDPLVALCHHYNVSKTLAVVVPTSATFDMLVARTGQMPSHVLSLTEPAPEGRAPVIAPTDVSSYRRGFRVDILNTEFTSQILYPTPYISSSTNALIVSLPIVHLTVPHTASMPLLLLFALSLETDLNLLACRLLPAAVIGEFPHAASMAQAMARLCTDDQYRRYYMYAQGLWKNVLALGPTNIKLVELVQTVWNVITDARRIRQRGRTVSGLAAASPVPSIPRQRTDSSASSSSRR